MSADSWQPERASLKSCCSASCAHGTARTEAQRLGLLACLATSNVKSIFACPWREQPAALLRKSERLQIAGSQKELAWKAVAQSHVPIALLAQRHRDLGLLACLATSNFKLSLGNGGVPCQAPSGSPAPKMRTSTGSWQPEGASLKSCFSASSSKGTARTEAQSLGLLACLATSKFQHILGGTSLAPPTAVL